MPYTRAATDSPNGFWPHGPLLSMGYYAKDSAAAAIYPGDVVVLEADGALAPAAANASTAIIGVAAAYSAVSTADTIPVYDHPDQLFVGQDDNDTTALSSVDVGANVNLVATSGNTLTLRSRMEIDSSTAATTTTNLGIRLISLHPMETGYATNATTSGAQARKWIVKFNQQALGQGAGI
jgi:hypothetical protein